MIQAEALAILKLGYNALLTGPPGSGKTFLLNQFIQYLKKHGESVAVTASTGIAATHMNGVTIHSWSGLGIKEKLGERDLEDLLRRPYLIKHFRKTEILIIDEISMLHSFQFDLVDQICRVFKENDEPFGGMQVVCSGDFFQLPPVQNRGKAAKFITESDVWPKMDIKVCYLEEQHRHKDVDLLSLLGHIRDNNLKESHKILSSKQLGKTVFSLSPPKLYTHNADVDVINNMELAKIPGKEFAYSMRGSGPKKLVQALQIGCLAPERLRLKNGAKVMFVKNNFEKGYVNGTLGKIVGFDEHKFPIVETCAGKMVIALPASWTIEEDGKERAAIYQLPLRLAWAITVHKSQGMTLDAAEVDLSKSFVEGMGYVALSRVRSFDGLKLLGINDLALQVNKEVLSLDKNLRQMSREAMVSLREEINQRMQLKDDKIKENIKEENKDHLSTYEKTRMLVAERLPLEEIASRRGLKQETIVSHLEKLARNNKIKETSLDYLKLPESRFEIIKIAFQQTGEMYLKPVREILGKDFSYQELRLARLFLTQKSARVNLSSQPRNYFQKS